MERVALQKCDSQLFHAELIAVFFVLKRASRDEVSHLAHVERSDVERTLEELVRQILVHPRGVRRLNFFGFREQADVLGDGEKTIDALLKLLAKFRPELMERRIDERAFVIFDDDRIRLGEHHLDQVNRHLKERPVFVHVPERLEMAFLYETLERGRDSEPDGKVESRLRPREDPRNGSKRRHAGVGFPLGGPRTDVQRTELGSWSGLRKVTDEFGRLENRLSIMRARVLAHFVHHLAPLVARERGRLERVLQNSRRVQIKRMEAVFLLTKVRLDHFTLNRHPDATVDGARRLRQHGDVRGTAASTDGAASTVEQREGDAEFLTRLHDALLSVVQRPRRGHAPGVLPTV